MRTVIKKLIKFHLKNTKVFSYEDVIIKNPENGIFILDMWNQCDEEDVEILPVKYVEYKTLQEKYLLKYDNIIVGRATDIC